MALGVLSDTDAAAQEPRDSRRWWVLGVMSLSILMVFLDNTVVNTALPTISRDLEASTATLQWVVDSYALVLAGLLLLGGTIDFLANLGAARGKLHVFVLFVVHHPPVAQGFEHARNGGHLDIHALGDVTYPHDLLFAVQIEDRLEIVFHDRGEGFVACFGFDRHRLFSIEVRNS